MQFHKNFVKNIGLIIAKIAKHTNILDLLDNKIFANHLVRKLVINRLQINWGCLNFEIINNQYFINF